MSSSMRESYNAAVERECEEFYAKQLMVTYGSDEAYEDWLIEKAEKEGSEIAKAMIETNNNNKKEIRL